MVDRISVLYVDDEPELLEVAVLFMENTGEFTITTADSADKALSLLKDNTYDAIISDYQMPEKDGIRFLQEVREWYTTIPFLLFTGKGREEVVIEAINSGADFYVQKGGDPRPQFAELGHKIKKAVAFHREQHQRLESEKRLHDIIDFLPDATFAIDQQGFVIAWNRAIENLSGVTAREMLGRGEYAYAIPFHGISRPVLIDMLNQDDQVVSERYPGFTRSGTTIYAETELFRGTPRRITVLAKACPLFDQEGRVTGAIETIRDITERKHSEKKILESEKKLHDIADLMPQMIFETDLEMRITYANRKGYEIFGFTDDDLDKGLFVDSLTGPKEHQNLIAVRENLKNGAESGPLEFQARRCDGTSFPVLVYAAPIRKENLIQGYRAVIIDITSRKEMEDEIRESEKKFRTIFFNSPYPVAINRLPDYSFVEINRAFLEVSGYREEEVIGKDPVTLGMISAAEALKLITHRILFGALENIPLAISAKNGRQVHVLFSTMPITIRNEAAVVTVVVEVTRLKRVEEDLIRANKELTAANISLQEAKEDLEQSLHTLSKKEEEIRTSEKKFRALVESSLDGILIIDFKGTILFLNRAAGEIVDVADHTVLAGAGNVMEFFPQESAEQLHRDLQNVAQGIDAYLVSYRLITRQGREIWIESIGKKVPYHETDAILVFIRDITERKRSEERVLESEQRFSTVFRSSPVVLTLVSALDGTFVDVNDAFVEFTGYSRGEAIGKTSTDLGIFPDREKYDEFCSVLRKDHVVYDVELQCRTKGGEVHTCLFSSRMLLMNQKPFLLSTVSNISERKAMDEAFQTIVGSMVGTCGMTSLETITEAVSHWLGADGVIIGVLTPDRKTVNVLSSYVRGISSAGFSYPLGGTPCEEVTRTGFCSYPSNAATNFPRMKEFLNFPDEAYIGTPLLDSTGDVFGVLCALSEHPLHPPGNVRDVLQIIAVKAAAEIERARIERALSENEALLEGAMDLAGLVMWEYNTGTGEFTFNERFYTLYGTSSLQEGGFVMSGARYFGTFVHPEDRAAVLQELEQAVSSRDPSFQARIEHRVIRRDGDVREIVVRIGVRAQDDGRTYTVYGANQDITERKRIEEALRQANRKLNLLSGITRHDIRNQLLTLGGSVELLVMENQEIGKKQEVSNIRSAVSQITNLIDFSREYEKVGVREPVWLSLPALVEEAKNGATRQDISIISDLPENAEVYADPLIAKVMFNLVDNAVRHGGEVTCIRFAFLERDGEGIITCEDDGRGVPDHEKERIFLPGYGKNTGFGLAISRQILDITRIAMRETGEQGKGARFEMVVPGGQYRIAR